MGIAEQNFGKIWPVHVDGFIRLLSSLRAAFDGDLDSVLILAVVGSAVLPRHKMPADMTYEQFLAGKARRELTTPLNTHSIAQITGVPRETVRRKLERMRTKGWAVRDSHGHWSIGDDARRDLEPMTDHSLEYLSTLAEVMRKTGKA